MLAPISLPFHQTLLLPTSKPLPKTPQLFAQCGLVMGIITQDNRMGEEVDLLVKVSEHFPAKINSTSSMISPWSSGSPLLSSIFSQMWVDLVRSRCLVEILVLDGSLRGWKITVRCDEEITTKRIWFGSKVAGIVGMKKLKSGSGLVAPFCLGKMKKTAARSFWFWREVEDEVESWGAVRSRFREGLFSIFVDNLNAQVDQKGLWEIFKPFGKVRDVFLSTPKDGIGRCYAFIRFATLSEASKVAKATDGMHVYGWPIWVKLAAYGWKDRRKVGMEGHGATNRVGRGSGSLGRGQGRGGPGGGSQHPNSQMDRSFAEALSGNQEEPKAQRSHDNTPIQVVEHSRSFELTVVRDASKVDYDWIRRHLGLTSGNFKEASKSSENWERLPEKVESQAPFLLAQKNSDKPEVSLSTRPARSASREKNR
ncbi:hypothetical protein Dsin_023730 [Dipteronia sinensis]|uniref:RRM domain-containing protein n=1 Tax=Dipteronia sinensis TaxID=43782 RepID=A0AAE0A4G6_9ROSI|nr:hypothetical protein Dsin_023730 [Dipteronia sinensis]